MADQDKCHKARPRSPERRKAKARKTLARKTKNLKHSSLQNYPEMFHENPTRTMKTANPAAYGEYKYRPKPVKWEEPEGFSFETPFRSKKKSD